MYRILNANCQFRVVYDNEIHFLLAALFTSEMMGIEESPNGVCCHCDEISQLNKKMFWLGLLQSILYILGMQDQQKRDQ